MKKILIVFLAVGLFQGASAWAQDFGHHGRDGGNGGSPGVGNGDSNGNNGNNGNGGNSDNNAKADNSAKSDNAGGDPATSKGDDQKVREGKPANGNQNNHSKGHPSNSPGFLGGNGNNGGLNKNNGRASGWNHSPNRNQNNKNQPFNRNQNNGVRGWNSHRGFQNPGRDWNRGNRPQGKVPPQDNISPHLKQIGVKRLPPSFADRKNILNADRAHSVVALPRKGPNGVAFHASVVPARNMSSTSIRTHMALVSNQAFVSAKVSLYNRRETQVNHYYWHSYKGFSYCHYYDPSGYHWYGWRVGSNFFWSRWYGDHWWWYDPVYYRWCYWYDGSWWWPDPYQTNLVYVYNDGNYVPANYSAVGAERVYRSKDGDRMVKVVGGDAFLYDTTDNPEFKPLFLASNANRASFSYDENGSISQVLVTLKDGSFQLFDAQGNPYSNDQGGDPDGGDAGDPPQQYEPQ